MANDPKRQFIKSLGIRDPALRRAVSKVPRAEFIPPEQRHLVYADTPLSIGCGQTISQPRLVVRMIELLELRQGDKVLEIGTGSGYQTALLAELGFVDVYSVELISELASRAIARLHDLGYTQVHLKQGDGSLGWPEYAPYQSIIVAAASSQLPEALVAQLDEGGRLIIPIGPSHASQTLWKLVKKGAQLLAHDMGAVSFVPLEHETSQTQSAA